MPPIFNSIDPSSNIVLKKGSSRIFSVNASDPEGKPLSYLWFVNTERQTTNTSNFKFKPEKKGIYSLKVVISDDRGLIIYFEWKVNVNEEVNSKAGYNLIPISLIIFAITILYINRRKISTI